MTDKQADEIIKLLKKQNQMLDSQQKWNGDIYHLIMSSKNNH